jgi:hypothetical protein
MTKLGVLTLSFPDFRDISIEKLANISKKLEKLVKFTLEKHKIFPKKTTRFYLRKNHCQWSHAPPSKVKKKYDVRFLGC